MEGEKIRKRTCYQCRTVKLITEFYTDGKRKDGTTKYRTECKECYIQRRKLLEIAKVNKNINGGFQDVKA